MNLIFPAFQAAIPRLDAALLPENAATIAENLNLERGTLHPLRDPKLYRQSSKTGDQLTLYRFAPVPGDPTSGWVFSWPFDVDCVKGPVTSNNQELTYWTGDSYPRFTDNSLAIGSGPLPAASYRLGIPDSNLAPQVEVIDDEPPPDDEEIDQRLVEERDYVVTFTSQLGSLVMEGPPSNPSDIVSVSPYQSVQLTHLPQPPSGNYKWTGKNLYRRLASSGQTSFHLVAELAPDADDYHDQLATRDIPGDTMLSGSWYPPPEDMFGLSVLNNGLMFGASDNDICISEPYLPHAWNPANRYPLPHRIVGLGQADNNIVAITEKNPYILSGANPAAMSSTELTLNQGCLSKRSIVSGNFGCCYASPDGLVIISSGGSRLLTEQVFTREQWQALNPASMLGATHEDRVIMSYTNGGNNGSFIIDPRQPENGVIFSSQYFTAAHKDGLLDSLLVFVPQANIRLWDEGDPLSYTWKSRLHILPAPATFTAARVEADTYNDTTLSVYAAHRVFQQPITSRDPVRLPGGYSDRHFQVKVTGTDTVRRVILGESVSELQ